MSHKSLPKLRRKQIQLEVAPEISVGAALVQMADKVHNCKDPPKGWSDKEVEYYAYWSYAICRDARNATFPDSVVEHLWYNYMCPLLVKDLNVERHRVDAVVQEYFKFLEE